MDKSQELLQYVKAWDDAMVRNNAEEIASFMSEEWVIVGTDGGISSKQDFLKWIRSGDLTHNRMDSEETRIRIYENTGVITSRGTSAGYYKGEAFRFYEWSTSVFIKSDKGWSCVHTMLTPAKEDHRPSGKQK